MKNKKGFTLAELVSVLVILAIVALIATPLVINLVNKSTLSANKRSVDAYGKAVETAAMKYLMDNGEYPTDLKSLSIEYSGFEVICNSMNVNPDGTIYLSECSVDGIEVRDGSTKDGWYHYGGYMAYKVGNKITFAGSEWYVIEDSDKTQEYVTLLKDKILTHEQLGDYGYVEHYECDEGDVEEGYNGCTTVGEFTRNIDGMPYYWSDTCHNEGAYGYTDWDDSGCDEMSGYKESKIKEALETVYMPTIGEENLVELDGYKIRLLNEAEMMNTFKYDLESFGDYYRDYLAPNDNIPTWLYTKFGEIKEILESYWTMYYYGGYNNRFWTINAFRWSDCGGDFCQDRPAGSGIYSRVIEPNGVRPVINLKKSAIK